MRCIILLTVDDLHGNIVLTDTHSSCGFETTDRPFFNYIELAYI